MRKLENRSAMAERGGEREYDGSRPMAKRLEGWKCRFHKMVAMRIRSEAQMREKSMPRAREVLFLGKVVCLVDDLPGASVV